MRLLVPPTQQHNDCSSISVVSKYLHSQMDTDNGLTLNKLYRCVLYMDLLYVFKVQFHGFVFKRVLFFSSRYVVVDVLVTCAAADVSVRFV